MKTLLSFIPTCFVFLLCSSTAIADTTTTKTYVQPQTLNNVNQINFSTFDVNGDGKYSMEEVGERLFVCFDQDRNQEIDNIEWTKKNVMTITPMEKETFEYTDTNDDGIAEKSTYTYETFYTASGLIKFDSNKDGLSAAEFIGEGFESLDNDENKMISLAEWKKAYMSSTQPKHNDPVNYN